jgi:hypothetical protein
LVTDLEVVYNAQEVISYISTSMRAEHITQAEYNYIALVITIKVVYYNAE